MVHREDDNSLEGAAVYAIATFDSKGAELAYVAKCLRTAGIRAVTVDVGVKDPPTVRPDVSREVVASFHPMSAVAVLDQADRGRAVSAMSAALVEYLKAEHAAGRVRGVLGIGGSGGTVLITPAMQALPIGLPKLMVSTIAAGNVGPFVGLSDITMMPAVVDVAGLNRVSRVVLANAAHAVVGMTSHVVPSSLPKPVVGLTMFGVTTPCVNAIRIDLEERGSECFVFHATGVGGRLLEKLTADGLIGAVIDVTTTEVADELVGGILSAGPERFDKLLAAGVPLVVSFGALDMVNFAAPETVPSRFQGRKFHRHNAQVTLMRTTTEENRQIGRWIAEKLNRSHAPLIAVIPEGGLSALDAPGQPFEDAEADAALFDEFERTLDQNERRQVRRMPHHINDKDFAIALLNAFAELTASGTRTP